MNRHFWGVMQTAYPEFTDTVRSLVLAAEAEPQADEALTIANPFERDTFQRAMQALRRDHEEAERHFVDMSQLAERIVGNPAIETEDTHRNVKDLYQQAAHSLFCSVPMEACLFGVWLGQMGFVKLTKPKRPTGDCP